MLALCACASGAWAQAVYSYVSPNYTTVVAPFTTAMQLTGTITSPTPFPPNLNQQPVGPGTPYPVTWSFSDGLNTYTDANSARVFGGSLDFWVTTDAAGVLTNAQVHLMSPGPVHSVNLPVRIMLAGGTASSTAGLVCSAVTVAQCTATEAAAGGLVFASVPGPGTWTQRSTAPVAVPGLGWPAMGVLALMLTGTLLRRRSAP